MNAFKELGLHDDLVKAVSDLGFETPTPIQVQAIPVVIDGESDLIGLAQTGTDHRRVLAVLAYLRA